MRCDVNLAICVSSEGRRCSLGTCVTVCVVRHLAMRLGVVRHDVTACMLIYTCDCVYTTSMPV
jgi:hypothetical protein